MTKMAGWYIGFAVANFLFAWMGLGLFALSAERQVHKMRLAMFRNIIYQEIGWFDAHSSGELNTRLTEYVFYSQFIRRSTKTKQDMLAMVVTLLEKLNMDNILNHKQNWKALISSSDGHRCFLHLSCIKANQNAWSRKKDDRQALTRPQPS